MTDSLRPWRLAIRILGNIAFACLLAVMLGLVFLLVRANLTGGTPTVAGHRLYVVLSGSMAPTFEAGSIVAVKPTPSESVRVGDIITFRDPLDSGIVVTHRVVGMMTGGERFITRGDANEVNDLAPVPTQNLIGTVSTHVPYVGYVVRYARTRQGLLSLVIIPGLVIIGFEFRTLLACVAALDREQKQRRAANRPDGTDVSS